MPRKLSDITIGTDISDRDENEAFEARTNLRNTLDDSVNLDAIDNLKELARQSSEALSSFRSGDERLHLTLTRATGESMETTVPGEALNLLIRVLKEIGKGHEARVYSFDSEITPNEAAEILCVSRPHLMKLMDAGKIPYRKVGTHRRIRLVDLETYREREYQARLKALDELAAESERLSLYE